MRDKDMGYSGSFKLFKLLKTRLSTPLQERLGINIIVSKMLDKQRRKESLESSRSYQRNQNLKTPRLYFSLFCLFYNEIGLNLRDLKM